jgi:DNA polymerase (family 10)
MQFRRSKIHEKKDLMKRTAKDNFERTSLEDALVVADKLADVLKPFCSRVEISGSIRRMKPEVGDIDIVVIPNDLEHFIDKVKEIIDYDYGGTKKVFGLFDERPINIFLSDTDSFGACLYQTTGPAMYNIRQRARVKKLGYKLNEYGLFDAEGNKLAGESEESIFNFLSWDFKEPNCRK